MADIFISYARPDRDHVEALGQILEDAGYSVWWDRQIVGGEDFYEAIERELSAARIVIATWSENSFKSRWVKDEAGVAAESGKLVAITLDGSVPPIGFRQFHAIDFSPQNEAARDDLLRSIAAKLSGKQAPTASFPSVPDAQSRPKAKQLGILAGVLVLAGLLLVWIINPNWLGLNPANSDRPFSQLPSETVAVPDKSIAVLPFADLSPDGDQEYFSDGIAEEILNALVRVPDLSVAGRTSSFYFKGRNIDLREIGQALGVAHILEGSVRKHDDRVRITAQLIRAEDGYHLWSETYDGTLEDVFDLQEQISRTIAHEMKIILSGTGQDRLAIPLTDNKLAYDWYLQGRQLSLSSFLGKDLLKARSMLEKAVEIDPNFAAAWAELARVNGQISAFVGTVSQDEIRENVKQAAEQALQADPDMALAQLAMNRHHRYSNRLLQATEYARRAVAIEPDNSEINGVMGDQYAYLGRIEDAKPYLQRAMELDPMRTDPWVFLAAIRHIDGDYDGSDRAARRAVELGNFGGYVLLSDNAYMRGDKQKAVDIFMELYSLVSAQMAEHLRAEHLWAAGSRAYYMDSETDAEALRSLASLALATENPDINAFNLGMMARLGMVDEMIEHWGKAGGANSVLGVLMWSDFPWAKSLRRHEKFPEFLKRQGFIEEWRENGWPDICRPLSGDDFVCD